MSTIDRFKSESLPNLTQGADDPGPDLDDTVKMALPSWLETGISAGRYEGRTYGVQNIGYWRLVLDLSLPGASPEAREGFLLGVLDGIRIRGHL